MTYYCYILKNDYLPHIQRTYNGSTVNPKRRIRQHNGIIKGGAKYTRSFGNSTWKIYVIIKGLPDYSNCLQCEWRIKHPDNKRKRPSKYNSVKGRIIGLIEVLKLDKWTNNSIFNNCDMNLEVWVEKEYEELFVNIPENIKINFVDEVNLEEI